jgi:hypothetical protein
VFSGAEERSGSGIFEGTSASRSVSLPVGEPEA